MQIHPLREMHLKAFDEVTNTSNVKANNAKKDDEEVEADVIVGLFSKRDLQAFIEEKKQWYFDLKGIFEGWLSKMWECIIPIQKEQFIIDFPAA